jgi:Tfp pilus assembly pilus retraction ATPase PilT
VMFVNPAIQNLIREDKIHQIPNAISTGMREDMISLDDSLADLVDRGVITFDTAYPHFEDQEKRNVVQKRHYRIAEIPAAGAPREAWTGGRHAP